MNDPNKPSHLPISPKKPLIQHLIAHIYTYNLYEGDFANSLSL